MKRFFQRDFRDTNPSMGKALLFGFLSVMVAIAITGAFTTKAKAWSGCSIGAFGSHLSGTAIPDAIPVGLGSTGQTAGLSAGCDIVLDKQFVVGAEASYSWMFGNLNDLGVDTDLSLTARAGYLFTPTVLPYIHGGWSRVEGSGGHIDGYKFGLGAEMKLASSPMYLDMRWSHGIWDIPGASGLDVTTDEFRLGLKIKLGPDFKIINEDAPAAKTTVAPKAKKIAP